MIGRMIGGILGKTRWPMLFIIAIMIGTICTAPVKADILPAVSDGETYSTILYGGWAGQEAWLEFDQDFNEKTAGDVLSLLGEIPGLEPQSIYGWYRMRGDISGEMPDEAHDFTIGTVYAIDTTPGAWTPYAAAEQVRWTSGPSVDHGYFGVGTEWHPNDNVVLDGAIWHDGGENYRITGTVDMDIRVGSNINAMAWMLVDNGDEWGLWRITARHPAGEDMDVVVVYEDSTRSDAVFLIGIGMEL